MQKQQSNIVFNNVKNTKIVGVEFGQWPLGILGTPDGPDEDGGIINATEIDWNEAVLPNSNITYGTSLTINTTGDLLNLVNEMQKEIYVLSAAVIALAGSV